MAAPASPIVVPPQPWTGRFDGEGAEHRRWWQVVTPYALRTLPAPASAGAGAPFRTRAAVLLGFGSDEGVRRNQGRVGAAAGPAAIRAALAPLAFHLNRDVHDAGDVPVAGQSLEAGQARAGLAITRLLDAGQLPVVLGGGHETAFASYLGIAGSAAVREGLRVGVLNLDAHFDLRDEPVPSSGTPFLQMARAEAAAGRELQYAVVGISEPNNTGALFRTAQELRVDYLLDEDSSATAAHAFVAAFLAQVDALHLSIDLDVLPASEAPGVSAPAAYGVPLPVVSAVCGQVAASGKLLHLDVAELNPRFDIDGRTAKVAARLVNRLLG
jgi:formiminoglutamase